MATTTAQSIPIPIPMPAYHQHSHPHPTPPPPHSPHRLLSNRRGSIAASDPWGNHSVLNLNPNRSSSSTLTIVRVTPTTPASSEPPPLDLHTPSSPRRVHRRLGSNGPPTPPAEGGRLSFAFSSFGQSSTTGGPASTSPNTSPKLRPSSPGLHHHHHRSGSSSSSSASLSVPLPSNLRLSPDQLFDLARQSTHPQSYSSSSSAGSNLVPPRSRTPNGGRPSSAAINTHEKITPATFTPLPEDIYLPFIDRPAEVAALITTAPSAKLFGLLAQTFPHNLTQSPRSEPALPLPADPLTWTYAQLYHHLTKTTRTVLPDAPWVRMVRRCILGRSELIWERVKGALGVPGDLDYEWDDSIGGEFDEEDEEQSMRMRYDNNEEALDMDSSSSDEQEDGGRKAHGHWEDWDATVDSPASPTQRRSPIVERFHVQEQHKTARERGQSLQDPGVYAGADRVERRRKTDEEQEETLAGVDSALKGILPTPTTNTGKMGSSNTSTTDSSSTSSTDSSPVNHLDYTTTNTTTASGHCATTAVTPDANDTALTSAMNPIEVHMQVDIDVHAHANCRGDSTDMDGDTVTAPTPREPSPPPPHQLASSAPQTYLSIVPLLASSSSSRDRGRQSSPATYSPTNTFHSHHTHTHSHSHSPSNTFSHHSPVNLNINVSLPPLSLPTSLTEISEDAEEEGEDGTPQGESSENDKDSNTEQSGDDVAEGEEDTTLIDPAQIQGLRIATSPMPSSPSALNPIALGSSYGSSLGMAMSGGSERSASFGSMGGSLSAGVVGAFRRSDSVSSSNEHNTRRYSHGASSMYGRGGEDEDIPYDPVGDRSPGNPLFPSNFARLALGPTLSANNPSLRSPAHPPLPRYGVNPYTSESKAGRSYSNSQAHNLPPVSIHSPGNFGDYRMGMPLSGIGRGNRFNRSSWGGPGSASDYAITVASEGSVGE